MSVHKGDPTMFTTTERYPHGQKLEPAKNDANGIALQRVALVTGAGQGIGRAIAIRLAQDSFDVAVSDIPSHRVRLQETADAIRMETGRRVRIVHADVSKEDEVKAMVDKVVDDLGGLDVMVANAGMAILEEFVDCTHLFPGIQPRAPLYILTHMRAQRNCQPGKRPSRRTSTASCSATNTPRRR